ncbi:MAG TPA: endo-1,3-alpha-glucanase family glycosylhydrolase [Aggregatilineaceae bacterium]|nr:endo-1,3-alpha-glucanase family glycosylhydrolase [Aggregatilineaceae bacterium]
MRKWLYFVLVVTLLAVPHPTAPQPAQAQGAPLVLAYFYGWFNSGQWSDGQLIDRPAEPYDSANGDVMARQISQAKSAGIDGFVMSWFGPDEPYTSGVFGGLLDQAAAQGFTAAVDIDMGQGFIPTTDSALSATSHAVNSLAAHPAYLRYNGKPVIFFWKQQRFTPAQWTDIRNQVDPNHNTIWIAEGAASEYIGPFDGLNLYNIAWSGNPAGTNATWATRTKNAGGYFVATAMPGFDESRLGRGEAVVRDRGNGDYFRSSFAGAVASNPHMIIITSWNEFFENSHIEPSANYGTFYLDLARELISSYKATGSVPAAPGGAPAQSAPAAQSPTGVFANPTVSGLNVRSAPTTDSDRVAGVSYPNAYPLLARNADNSWFLIDYGGGQGWISAQYATYTGDLNAVPVQ